MTSHNEAQKTNEEIVEEFKSKFVDTCRDINGDVAYYEFIAEDYAEEAIDWLRTILSTRDQQHKKEMEEAVKAERERIIYITKNIKDAFMSPLTERRWLQCIQFTDQPKPKDQSKLDQPVGSTDT